MNASKLLTTPDRSNIAGTASARPSRLLTALLAMMLTALLMSGTAPANDNGTQQSVFDRSTALR